MQNKVSSCVVLQSYDICWLQYKLNAINLLSSACLPVVCPSWLGALTS